MYGTDVTLDSTLSRDSCQHLEDEEKFTQTIDIFGGFPYSS